MASFVSNVKLCLPLKKLLYFDITWVQLQVSVGYLPTQMCCSQTGMLCSGCTLQTAHEVLQMWISFFVSLPDMMWVRVSGCAAMCTFKKCATTQYLDWRKEVCTSSGFVRLTRPEWDVPPRLLIPSVQRTLWNTPEQQVNGEPVWNSKNSCCCYCVHTVQI